VNIDAPWPDLDEAEQRVLGMLTKLHRWAGSDPRRRFDDLYNLVADPAFLVVAWNRVRVNKGARSAGVDGIAPRSIGSGAGEFLSGLRDDLKARRFTPVRVREMMIPKANGKPRRLGIPTAADRVVQATLKLVLEPIFEADFKACSYGFRPRRRAQDAIAEIFYLASPSRTYEWVFEADIAAVLRRDRPPGPDGPGATSRTDSREAWPSPATERWCPDWQSSSPKRSSRLPTSSPTPPRSGRHQYRLCRVDPFHGQYSSTARPSATCSGGRRHAGADRHLTEKIP
jgi:Reverse transcriptase (RNA-dependent DNA polymerase)